MTIKKQVISVSTIADGSGSGLGTPILGKLYAIGYRPGTLDTGATITVTCEADGLSKALLTKANAGTSNVDFYPRDLQNAVADGAALTGTAGGDRALPILAGKPKIVVASGGDTKSGSIIIFYEE